MKKQKICILGSGHGAFTISADMALAGHRVTMWEDELFAANIAKVKETKRIALSGDSRNGVGELYKVTTDLSDAVSDVDIILVSMPAFAHVITAKKLAKVVKPGHIVFICPCATFGSLVFAKIFHDAGVLKGVKICEINTMPYGCRKINDESAVANTYCKKLFFAAFPASDTKALFEEIKELYPAVTPVSSVMESSINNGNIDVHAPVMVYNASHTDNNLENFHYRDGITPSVARALDKIDLERQQFCRAFDCRIIDIPALAFESGYAPCLAKSTYETFKSSNTWVHSNGPTNLQSRYLTEDGPYTMVPLTLLGEQLGFDMKYMRSVANLGGALLDEDFWQNGRKLEELGVAGMTIDQMKEFLQNGYQE